MKIKDKFKEITSYQEINFQEWFGDMKYEKKVSELYSKTLERNMSDSEILSELKPTELTLGEVFNYLKNEVNKSSRKIFYCRDKDGVLRAVDVGWNNDGMYVGAYSVEVPFGWFGGGKVFSRFPFDSVNDRLDKMNNSSIPQKLSPSETVLQTFTRFISKSPQTQQYDVMESEDVLVIKRK